MGFDRIEEPDAALPEKYLRREPLPWEAGFLAAKCFVNYRRSLIFILVIMRRSADTLC